MEMYVLFITFVIGSILMVVSYNMGRKEGYDRGYEEGSSFVIEEWKNHVRRNGGDI